MGKYFIDRFSLLHMATGIISYFFGIKFIWWFIIHLLFEIIENLPSSIKFIDNYITIWPGGKKHPDSVINSIGDQTFAMIGWLLAYAAYFNFLFSFILFTCPKKPGYRHP